MQSFWDRIYWDNTVLAYALAAGGILLAWVVIRIVRNFILKWIKRITEKTDNNYDDILISVIENFVIPYLYIFVNFAIVQQLNLHPRLDNILDGAMAFVTMYYSVRLVNHVMHLMISGYMRRKGESEERIRHLSGMLIIVKIFVWVIGLLTLANNFGYDVSTLLASLGVGGIAIALASQAILGDLFSYLVIFFDKPFEIGDFLIMGDVLGTVEHIGIKTTRIRSLSGEQLVMSNTAMTNSVIRNYKRMERRRVVFKLGVIYQTSYQNLQLIPGMIKDIITAQENVTFDRAHLAQYGDFSINFEMVYYVLSPDYNLYMDTQQAILFQIHEAFQKHGIEFAYPTQTLFLEGAGRENGAGKNEIKAGEQAER